ncbi:uncharacterized protein MONBRDRAFT_32592 [Monosiga brevicollis MX1]|uniref:Uncharacterized protein n=1 Tax=Monosiga brevicollis TaxID=81824 RepID=A9V0J1_MONBE|nr:uncharacterized protein MONBRDRAFT_32592 [Monosiga brevicollis MX1]EDQ89025.1 predicted protein [Monosiga brevicollis MX1]|eukprot:XP_001746130.1 hypothetical protein [Monosiga brevicollis MX1]
MDAMIKERSRLVNARLRDEHNHESGWKMARTPSDEDLWKRIQKQNDDAIAQQIQADSAPVEAGAIETGEGYSQADFLALLSGAAAPALSEDDESASMDTSADASPAPAPPAQAGNRPVRADWTFDRASYKPALAMDPAARALKLRQTMAKSRRRGHAGSKRTILHSRAVDDADVNLSLQAGEVLTKAKVTRSPLGSRAESRAESEGQASFDSALSDSGGLRRVGNNRPGMFFPEPNEASAYDRRFSVDLNEASPDDDETTAKLERALNRTDSMRSHGSETGRPLPSTRPDLDTLVEDEDDDGLPSIHTPPPTDEVEPNSSVSISQYDRDFRVASSEALTEDLTEGADDVFIAESAANTEECGATSTEAAEGTVVMRRASFAMAAPGRRTSYVGLVPAVTVQEPSKSPVRSDTAASHPYQPTHKDEPRAAAPTPPLLRRRSNSNPERMQGILKVSLQAQQSLEDERQNRSCTPPPPLERRHSGSLDTALDALDDEDEAVTGVAPTLVRKGTITKGIKAHKHRKRGGVRAAGSRSPPQANVVPTKARAGAATLADTPQAMETQMSDAIAAESSTEVPTWKREALRRRSARLSSRRQKSSSTEPEPNSSENELASALERIRRTGSFKKTKPSSSSVGTSGPATIPEDRIASHSPAAAATSSGRRSPRGSVTLQNEWNRDFSQAELDAMPPWKREFVLRKRSSARLLDPTS